MTPSNARGALIPFVIVAVLVLSLVLGASLQPFETKKRVLEPFGIIPLAWPYADLETVLGWQTCKSGVDPSSGCPASHFNMPMNYPKTWLVLGCVGLNVTHTLKLGILLEVLFLVSLVPAVCPLSFKRALPLLALLPSPPVIFALERCNADLIIFPLIILSSYVRDEIGRAHV